MENSLEIAFAQKGEIMKTQDKEEKNRADTGGDLEKKDFAEKDGNHASVKQPLVPFVKNEGKDVAEKDGDHASVKQPCVAPFVKNEGKDVAEKDDNHASVKQPCVVPILKNEGKDVTEKDGDHASVRQPCVIPILKNEGKESDPFRIATVLAERNHDNTASCNAASKMVSPVLLKLRRNQEKRVTPANPVDPVQVPPKHFRRFPADRYMSPTDSIMSPVSRGLLAMSRRSNSLPPAIDPSKVLDHKFQNTEATEHISR